MWEAGYKGDFSTGDFNYVIENLINPMNTPVWAIDPAHSNDFRFTQNVNALYMTFGQAIDKFSYMF